MLNKIKGWLLGGVDLINIQLNPFHRFERDEENVDKKSLEEKASFFWGNIQNHWLFGRDREFYWSMKPNDLGDMAIWQGLYAFTCAAKEDEEAVERALRGLELLQVLGGHRLSRGADLLEGAHQVDPSRKYYVKDGYTYVQEVSESTLIGHLFGLWGIMHLGSNVIHKRRAEALLEALAQQVLDDDCSLRNQEGVTAKFGNLKPGLLTAPIRIAALAALLLQSPNSNHRKRYEELADEYMGSLAHPETHFLWIHPVYQDMLAYMVLLMLCSDEKRCDRYRKALEVQWAKNKEEGNSFYTYILLLAHVKVEDKYLVNAKKILNEFSTVSFKPQGFSDNSDVESFVWGWKSLRGGEKLARQPLPIWKRPASDIVWQRNPYSLKGYADREYNGLDFLAAYYLGLRTKAI